MNVSITSIAGFAAGQVEKSFAAAAVAVLGPHPSRASAIRRAMGSACLVIRASYPMPDGAGRCADQRFNLLLE
jgi:hypothetical protein